MWKNIPTPCYVVDEKKLKDNLKILQSVEQETGCHILLAQKAFSMYALYPMIGQYISGTTASGLYEARLGHEEMGKENHVFAPAYKERDMEELVEICDHMVFNSFAQYKKHRDMVKQRSSIGIRINPEYSTQEGHAIYDPCAPGSRLGVTFSEFEKGLLELGMSREADGSLALPADIEGLHFHTLCEQDADDLQTTFYAFEEKFDIIYCSLTSMHFEDKKRFLSKVSVLLNPDGIFCISLDKNQSEYIDMGTRKLRIYPDTPENITGLSGQCGMTVTEKHETEFAHIIKLSKGEEK